LYFVLLWGKRVWLLLLLLLLWGKCVWLLLLLLLWGKRVWLLLLLLGVSVYGCCCLSVEIC
jgi:hypothetical protein